MGEDNKDLELVMRSTTGIVNAVATLGIAQAAIGLVVEPLKRLVKRLEIEEELERVLGKEFVGDCNNDVECSKTIDDIVKTTIEFEERMTEEEKEKAREKVLEILRKKLNELGIEFSCDELDLGELGTAYKDCYIEFMGEEYSISEVM